MATTDPPLGTPLVEAIAAKLTEAHATNVGVTHDSLSALIDRVLEGHESDLAAITGPILAQHVNGLDVPAPVKHLFDVLQDPAHQTQFFTALFAVRAIIDQFVFAAIAPLVQDVTNKAWPILGANVPLSPAEAAIAVLKGVLTEAEGATWAAQSGTGAAAFRDMVQIAGQAIGIDEALLLYRRGDITEAELERIVRYSNVRIDFLPDILKLRYLPPSVGEVLAGAVQNQLPVDEARTKFDNAGLAPDNFDWMLATHGRPPGLGELGELVNRGLATADDFAQAVRESDIKDKYIDKLQHLREYVPPVRSTMAMLRAGAITDAQAETLFRENGVRAVDIPGYLAEAHHQRTATARELSQAQIVRMYSAQLMDRPTATAKLAALHYDPATVTMLLDFADDARHERYVNAVVGRVHARYTAHKITASEAHQALTADGLAPAAITDLLALWDIERGANLHVLSPASVVGAYRRGDIGAAETKRRLLAVGVQQADLGIVVADGWPPNKPNPAAVQAVLDA